jgi:hypothetical protein
MRSSLFVAVAILLVLGILFARDRLKLAFKVGAMLYGVVLVFRFLLFSSADPDNLADLAVVLAIFALFWVAAWAVTTAILRRRTGQGTRGAGRAATDD